MMIRGDRVTITGSSGLIGTAVAAALESQGVEVVRLDVRAAEGCGQGDVRDLDYVRKAVEGCDGIVHLAAVSRVLEAEQDPRLCWETNVNGLQNVLQTATASPKRPWFVFASSREVYGQPEAFPVTEECPVSPINVYGRAKVEGERLVANARNDGVRACTIRLSNVYGEVDDYPDRVIPAFIRQALTGRPLRVDGMDHAFDFTHLEDVTRGVVTLAELLSDGGAPPPPIHFVSGIPTSLGQLAQRVIDLSDSTSEIQCAPPRSYDVSRFFGSPQRARELLGWFSLVRLEDGLAGLIAAFRATSMEDEPGMTAERLS